MKRRYIKSVMLTLGLSIALTMSAEGVFAKAEAEKIPITLKVPVKLQKLNPTVSRVWVLALLYNVAPAPKDDFGSILLSFASGANFGISENISGAAMVSYDLGPEDEGNLDKIFEIGPFTDAKPQGSQIPKSYRLWLVLAYKKGKLEDDFCVPWINSSKSQGCEYAEMNPSAPFLAEYAGNITWK